MNEHRAFTGFFSYAKHDAATDPSGVEAFTTDLEMRVNAALANVRFAIWRDENELRVGEKWQVKLEEELSRSDILIVLLTPRWIESGFCRKEYLLFEEAAAKRGIEGHVLPLLARSLEAQEKHFTPDQTDVCARLRERQYRRALVSDFITLSRARRTTLIEGLADDIVGMIDKLRLLPAPAGLKGPEKLRSRPAKEFDAAAHNFANVDFIKAADVALDREVVNNTRSVYAQVDFLDRLYVQGKRGRIDFGVRRAILSVGNDGGGKLSKVEDLNIHKQNIYYITLHDAPDNVSVCIDPEAGKAALAELALPPAKNQNYLSQIAVVSGDVTIDQLKAELIVSLNVEGLHLTEEKEGVLPPRMQANIKAIMDVAIAKVATADDQSSVSAGLLRRKVPVRER